MKTIDTLKRAIESLGGRLDDCGDFFYLDAPSGYVWKANGLPGYKIEWASRSQTWLVQAVREESESLRMGLEKVTSEKELAEHRWNLDDDGWGAPADAPETLEWPL
jgi:hypothetical protein